MERHNEIRAIAVFEGFKGLVAVCAASGLLLLVHEDLHTLAVSLVEHAHLNPAAKYPRILVEAATHLQDSRLALLALGAGAYSLLRFVEAYGLYREKTWAELLAAASGAIYVPFEVAELIHRPGLLSTALLTINLAIVGIMLRALRQRWLSRING